MFMLSFQLQIQGGCEALKVTMSELNIASHPDTAEGDGGV